LKFRGGNEDSREVNAMVDDRKGWLLSECGSESFRIDGWIGWLDGSFGFRQFEICCTDGMREASFRMLDTILTEPRDKWLSEETRPQNLRKKAQCGLEGSAQKTSSSSTSPNST
jgi:hypothetical protein